MNISLPVSSLPFHDLGPAQPKVGLQRGTLLFNAKFGFALPVLEQSEIRIRTIPSKQQEIL